MKYILILMIAFTVSNAQAGEYEICWSNCLALNVEVSTCTELCSAFLPPQVPTDDPFPFPPDEDEDIYH